MADGTSRGGERSEDSRLSSLPADLVAVTAFVVLADLVVLVPVVNESPLRVVLGAPLVLFLPGYALVAALFPAAGSTGETTADGPDPDETGRGIDGIERVALSVALGIPVVALVGLGLSLTPLGVGLATTLPTLSVLTLAATAVAARRRAALPAADQFRVPYRSWLATARAAAFEPESRTDLVLNVLLAATLVVATASVAFAVAAPTEGEAFTEFYLLTENESGDLVADDYPTEFDRGESRPVVLGIENHEGERVAYTVVAQLQRVRVDGNETSVLEARQFDRFTVALEPNGTWLRERSITPTMVGERLRLVYLLYRGSPPDDPSVSNAYRSVDLLVTVRE